MQEGCCAFEEHLYSCAEQRHLVEVKSKAAADEAEAVMKKEDEAANSAVEHQGEKGVIHEVAIHDAAPEEVAVCMGRAHQLGVQQGYACTRSRPELPKILTSKWPGEGSINDSGSCD